MDEKRYETVEIQIDAELLEQLKKVIAPMGLTPEMLAVQFFEFCVNPRHPGAGHLTTFEMEGRTGS